MRYELIIDKGNLITEISYVVKDGKAIRVSTWWFNRKKDTWKEHRTNEYADFEGREDFLYPLYTIHIDTGKGINFADVCIPRQGDCSRKDLHKTMEYFRKAGIKLPKVNVHCWGGFCRSSSNLQGNEGTIICQDGKARCEYCALRIGTIESKGVVI